MKIALVSPYDFAYPGGVVNHISSLERHLTRMGHEVKIIAPASRAISSFGERFIRVGRPRPVPVSGSIARITLSPWLTSRMKNIYEQERFDICHFHEPFMPMLCTTALRLCETPVVATFHASGGKPWYTMCTPLGQRYLKKWYRKIDARIGVSQVAVDYVCKHFPGDYEIIPNGIDTKHFNPAVPPVAEFMDGRVNILFVGRLEKRKGLDYLLGAYAEVKRKIPEARLIVVGPGTRLRRKYEKYVAQNHLEDVVFIGYSDYSELPGYYSTADVVCSPAIGRESFGIVLLEAMATGRPLVASDIPGYTSVVTDGIEGILVPPQNTQKLAEALVTLITDKSLRREMGLRGRVKALEYDWGQITQRVMDVYLMVLNSSHRKEAALISSK